MMDDEQIREAFEIAKLISSEQLTAEEATRLEAWKSRSAAHRQLVTESIAAPVVREGLLQLETYDTHQIAADLFEAAGIGADKLPGRKGRLVRLRTWWAAAGMLLLMAGAGYWWTQHRVSSTTLAVNNVSTLIPGSNKARLVLPGGEEVVLDSTGNGLLTLQGNVQVHKSANGQLTYEGNNGEEIQYHTLVTPRGGRFQLTLADGTKVVLNAASSIRFPVAFSGSTRSVSITGEAYFEVAANKNKPFIVDAAGSSIKVLGTHFNIMAYEDEPVMKTTLVQGAVLVEKNTQQVKIVPGQQATLHSGSDVITVGNANLEEVLAWTRDEFIFKSQNIRNIMRQIARWYDADIEYQGDVADISFSGGMSRHEGIQHLLELLEADGRLRFTATGKKIIISRKAK
ncbi:FecR family protein [Chitinophaga flava]|uniref:Iron dicitrate transport regulator FecR n=1 Tax=Chitinophaga flava TaxID=2259036 RepID=A0A365Y1I0_9BACT|nr:FecR domain-containing protein [Chitinophaga flava]RBL91774.1 hypothetical protein DF182_03980 [Chitinophaga flava]